MDVSHNFMVKFSTTGEAEIIFKEITNWNILYKVQNFVNFTSIGGIEDGRYILSVPIDDPRLFTIVLQAFCYS